MSLEDSLSCSSFSSQISSPTSHVSGAGIGLLRASRPLHFMPWDRPQLCQLKHPPAMPPSSSSSPPFATTPRLIKAVVFQANSRHHFGQLSHHFSPLSPELSPNPTYLLELTILIMLLSIFFIPASTWWVQLFSFSLSKASSDRVEHHPAH